MSTVTFDRTPYIVQYYKDGKKETLKRTPPPKLHDIMPGDSVTIKRRKNVDWDEGMQAKVKGINKRHPNTLQIENEATGKYTFVTFYDVNHERSASDEGSDAPLAREEARRKADPIGSNYLLWP